MSATAPAKTKELCIVDYHPAEPDCRRIQVDFRVLLEIGTLVYAARAVDMCGAGLRMASDAPVQPGDSIRLRMSFPGISQEVSATARVNLSADGVIGCEFWAANGYQQQFVDAFVQACARRQQLRSATPCGHGIALAAHA
jgi:hypothetical protein